MESLFIIFAAIVVYAIYVASSRAGRTTPDTTGSSRRYSARPPASRTAQEHTSVDLHDLLPREFVILDLETTGLSRVHDEIIEIGAIRVDLDGVDREDRAECPVFQTLVKPLNGIPEGATKINGITQEMLDQEGIELKEAMQQFMEFVGDLPLVTYNAALDMGFLWKAAERCDLTLSNRYDCALKRTRRAFPDLPNHKLTYIAELLQLPDDDTHRALGDCKRTVTVFVTSVSTLGTKVRWTHPPKTLQRRSSI
jgi:DNA polymerase-3 subunit epsilon